MKKLAAIILTLVIVALSLVLAGCAGSGQSGDAQTSDDDDQRIVIYGEIKETLGNMITIDLIEQPMRPREMTEEEREAMREMMEQNGDQDGQVHIWSGEMPEGSGERLSGEMPEGFSGEMPEGFVERFSIEIPEGMSEEDIANMPGVRVGMGVNYTGESKDIIIPAGAPIMESSFAGGEQNESEINLANLKSGDIIEITYASDGETVARVVKQPTRQGIRRDASGSGDGEVVEFFNPDVSPSP